MGFRILAAGVGLTHYYNQLLNRLQTDLGAEVSVAVAGDGRGHTGEGVFQTEEGARFAIHRLREWTVPGHYRSFLGLSSLVRKLEPEIVITGADYLPAFTFEPLLAASVRSRRAKILAKSIPFRVPSYPEARATARGPLRRAAVELRAMSFRRADAHVLHVPAGVMLYRSWGVPEDRIFVAGNSPDTDLLFAARERAEAAPPILPPNPHRIIHVGRLVGWKRVDLLIDALASLRQRFAGAELVVVGEGPERDRLLERAKAAGVTEAVRFAGGVYDPVELGRYFLAASVYVLAGMGGLSLNDAMSFGKPVVCSVCDGTERLLVREGENGHYFDDGNLESLISAIARVLEDPDRCRSMGERSTQIVRDEVNIHTVLAVYRKAIERLRLLRSARR